MNSKNIIFEGQQSNQLFWLALYTRSQAEKKIELHFNGSGVECYLPVRRELRQWSDRKKWIEVPLLRNYIFVRIRLCDIFEVMKTPGCVSVVTFGGVPATIPDKQIDDLKSFLKDSERIVEVTSELFEKGDLVEVSDGPLKGVEGEVIEVRGKRHIVLAFKSLGCNVFTEISNDDVIRTIGISECVC